MKTDRMITKMLSQTANIMNVLNGGMSKANITFRKEEHHYLFRLEVPGVSADRYNVEINQDNLFIYQLMSFETDIQIPYLVTRFNIPADVDFDKITAEYEQGRLTIVLPFNELANGYRRGVEIHKR